MKSPNQLPKEGIAREIPQSLYCDDVAFDAIVDNEADCKCYAEDMRHVIKLHQTATDKHGGFIIHWWMKCETCGAEMPIRVMD